MNILIAYDSFYGSTEDCVKTISKKVEGNVTVKKGEELKKIDVSSYDKIIIGSPIKFGSVLKSVKKFCKKNLNQLLEKPVALFVCCAEQGGAEEYFKKSFPLDLINDSFTCVCLGGRLPTNPQGMTDKAAVKSATKAFTQNGLKLPNISKKMVNSFIEEINNYGKATE